MMSILLAREKNLLDQLDIIIDKGESTSSTYIKTKAKFYKNVQDPYCKGEKHVDR
jgi:hypothetical protein